MTSAFLPSELLTRGLWAAAIIACGLAFYWLANQLILVRAKRNGSTIYHLPGARSGVPAILYFTTPGCVPCKTIQRPALQNLKERLGDQLQVIEVDAEERPDLASRWGVLSVPTTFIIDKDGNLRHVNHGATRAEKLYKQVEATPQ